MLLLGFLTYNPNLGPYKSLQGNGFKFFLDLSEWDYLHIFQHLIMIAMQFWWNSIKHNNKQTKTAIDITVLDAQG
uniref:Uncharacterized protein n=1 Tax=Lepeophtheirus salmonis TaxID=72036 RepID=A0A0K2TZ34_LEPSM